MKQHISNSHRMLQRAVFTFLLANFQLCASNLINLNDAKSFAPTTRIFKCPVAPDPLISGLSSNQLDTSILVFKDNSLADLLNTGSLVVSNQAQIVHKVAYHHRVDDYTFAYANAASLEYIFEQTGTTKMNNRSANFFDSKQSSIEEHTFKEELSESSTLDELKKLTGADEAASGQRVFYVNHQEVYKCVGRPVYVQSNKTKSILLIL